MRAVFEAKTANMGVDAFDAAAATVELDHALGHDQGAAAAADAPELLVHKLVDEGACSACRKCRV
jgi:hypothetical protein